MRFILRQHSPDWRAFSLEEISVYRESVVTTSTLGQADRGRGVRTAAAASRSAPWTDPARPPAGPRAAVARREDKANKLEHSAPRTCNTEKETRGHRGWLLQTGLCGLWVAPGHSRGLQVVPQDTQGTPGDPRGSSVSAGLSDPYIVLLVEPGEQPVPDLGGRWHPGDSGGHSRGSRWSPGDSRGPQCPRCPLVFEVQNAGTSQRDLAPAMADSD